MLLLNEVEHLLAVHAHESTKLAHRLAAVLIYLLADGADEGVIAIPVHLRDAVALLVHEIGECVVQVLGIHVLKAGFAVVVAECVDDAAHVEVLLRLGGEEDVDVEGGVGEQVFDVRVDTLVPCGFEVAPDVPGFDPLLANALGSGRRISGYRRNQLVLQGPDEAGFLHDGLIEVVERACEARLLVVRASLGHLVGGHGIVVIPKGLVAPTAVAVPSDLIAQPCDIGLAVFLCHVSSPPSCEKGGRDEPAPPGHRLI